MPTPSPDSDVYARLRALGLNLPPQAQPDMMTQTKGCEMELIDTHHTRTGSDFRYLGNLLGSPGHLPEIPLHEYGPLTIQFSVLGGTTAEKADRFAKIASDLRAIAKDQALKYAEETTSLTSEDKHHRATLIMPQGKVMYAAVWIERAEQVVDDAV